MAASGCGDGGSGADEILIATVEDGVVLLTLNRPTVRNAFSFRMFEELTAACRRIARDPEVRIVIISGAGEGFCSGADLSMIEDIDPDRASVPEVMRMFAYAEELVQAIRAMPQPVIAAVNGAAAGGGFALALACDLRVCVPSASFIASFVRFGLMGCELGVSYLLPKIVGVSAAFEMVLTGRPVGAEEAQRLGLVLDVVPGDRLLRRTMDIARAIRANSPFGVRLTKEVMWRNLGAADFDQAMQLEMRCQLLAARTADHREAVLAYLERRPATYRCG